MNRAAMRVILRRRLGDTSSDQWTDSILNESLNTALFLVQREIMKVAPLFVLNRASYDIVSGTELYPKPNGFLMETEVGYLDSAASLSYRPLLIRDYYVGRDSLSSEEITYSHWGNYFAIHPLPSTSTSAGIRLDYVPTLEMGSDTVSPVEIPLGLHLAIVYWAQLILIGETADSLDQTAKALQSFLADIPMYFSQSGSRPQQLNPDIEKGYGGIGGISRPVSNGRWQR